MERGEGLLADGFDGDWMNLVVPRRLEQGFRVRAVGLAEAVNDIETPRVKELESRGGRSS